MSTFNLSALLAPVQQALQDYSTAEPAPAILIEVWRDGVSVQDSYGVSDLETQTPAEAGQVYEVGSQTKMMTTVVVLQMVAEGKMDLDSSLSDYLPVAALDGIANADQVTLRQLLSNTSGIPDYDEVVGDSGLPVLIEQILSDPSAPLGPKGLLDIAKGQPATSAPGTEYEYSNTNFLLLGQAIEAVSGNTLAEEMQTRVFEPAGMTSTSMKSAGVMGDLLHSYAQNPLDGETLDVTGIPIDLGAEGGAVSSTGDMIRFMDALLVSKTLLPEAQLAEMTNFTEIAADPATELAFSFGLGLSLNTIYGQQFIGFDGGTLGTNTSTYLHVESGTIVTVVATHSDTSPESLALSAFETIFNDSAWASFDPHADSFDITGTAAEIDLTEGVGVDGEAQTDFALGQATLTFEGGLDALDGGRFNFDDGSILWLGEDGRDSFDVMNDARDAANADNQLLGLDGNDRLSGGHGNDVLRGGDGNDRLRGRDGDDQLEGGAGRDHLIGGSGNDMLSGGDGRDNLRGGQGDDALDGGDCRDFLRGGQGNDVLDGGSGRDWLNGGRGDDTIEGGTGNDMLSGGAGADHFVFASDAGCDVIVDFQSGVDQLDFSQTGLQHADIEIIGGCAQTVIEYGDNNMLIVTGDITQSDFIF